MPTPTTIRGIHLGPAMITRAGRPTPNHNGEWGVVRVEITDAGNTPFTPGRTYDFSGNFRPAQLIRGTEYLFSGSPSEYRGRPQFKFTGFARPDREMTDGECLAYLGSCGHLTPTVVRVLFDTLGRSAVESLIADPAGTAERIRRMNSRVKFFTDQAESAAAWFKARTEGESTRAELSTMFAGIGFPRSLADDVFDLWGVGAADRIRRNPYFLIDNFAGVGFPKADTLYMRLNLPPAKLRRQALCAVAAVKADADSENHDQGDTWVRESTLHAEIRRRVSGVRRLYPRAAVKLACHQRLIARYDDPTTRTAYYAEYNKAAEETELADLILAALDEPNPYEELLSHPQAETCFARLSDHQRSELYSGLRGAVSGLTGGPGTGKTFTTAALIKLAVAAWGADRITVMALAGKAAQRSAESLREYDLPLTTATIHSTLGVKSFGGGKSGSPVFEYGRDNPLPAKLIVVDEFSLNDVAMALAVFRARAAGAAIFIIGDVQQLLPIGHGAPLRDCLAADVPFARLTEVHRNAGTVVRVCEKIGKGLRVGASDFDPIAAMNVVDKPPRNLALLPASTAEQAADRIIEALNIAREKFAVDPVWDCQVIVARNGVKKKGAGEDWTPPPLSRIALNARLQREFNPTGEPITGTDFRIGDKCIQLTNQRLESTTGAAVTVCNGEFCRVEGYEEGRLIVRFFYPDRLIAFNPRLRAADDKVSFDLGYAATCHKMQGSQEKFCVYAVDGRSGTREHPFTGISRCVVGGFVVGSLSDLNAMIGKSGLKGRKTFLREKIEAGRVWGERVWWLKGERKELVEA